MGSAVKSINPDQLVNNLLKETGGSSEMAVNGAVTPVPFFFTAPGNMIFGRIHCYIEGQTNFSAEKFADLAALTNGVQLKVGGEILDNWQVNTDMLLAADIIGPAGRVFATELKSLAWIWSLHECIGGADGIQMASGDTVELLIKDDLSSLVTFCAKIQGALIGD